MPNPLDDSHPISGVEAVAGPSVTATATVDPTLRPDWDVEVASLPGASVFHSAGWAAVLKQTYGFQPFYAVQEQGGRLCGVLPLMEVRRPWGTRRGVSLPFTDSCGLLTRDGEPTPQLSNRAEVEASSSSPVSQALLRCTRQLARERRWSRLELRPRATPSSQVPSSVRYVSHRVPLHRSEAAQRESCAPAMKRALRQAEAGGLQIAVGSDLALLKSYFQLHCLTRRRQGAPPQPWEFFSRLHQHVLSAGHGFVVLAREDETPTAGAVFLHFAGEAVYKFGASDATRWERRPNQLVMWTGFRHAAQLGCTSVDLGRTSLDNEGLRRFKRNWGATEEDLSYQCFDLSAGSLVPIADRTQGWQTLCFRHLPIAVGRLLGRWAYRFAA